MLKHGTICNPTRPGGLDQILVTDRALRYRANRNAPPGPAVCTYCGSDRAADIEHIDGREENTAPANLTYSCRSCNSLKGAYFARNGIGRKTRQYNSARPARSFGEWANAVLSIQGSGGTLSPSQAIPRIQATPQPRRVAYAAQLARAKVETARRNRNPEEGPHGPILRGFYHDPESAIAKLKQMRTGEAVAALHHPAVGDIDLIWGEAGTSAKGFHDGSGLAKILQIRPAIADNLQRFIETLEVLERGPNRIRLGDPQGRRAIVRLDWDGVRKVWLLTAYQIPGKANPPRKNKPSAGGRTDVPGTHAVNRHTPSLGGSITSIGRNGKRGNPSAPEPGYEQYLWAVKEHARGAHDAGGKVIHATSPTTRKVYAQRIADFKRARRGVAPF
jgi:hypothetical protein